MKNTGMLAERAAANYLLKKKYTLLAHNYSCRFGEIDIVAQKNGVIAFVEVKARNENSIAEPREFVDFNKQKRIIAAAQIYLSSKNVQLQPRFDVIEVFYKKDKIKSIKHLENAFGLD